MNDRAETGLFLEGLHCAGCVGRVEAALREVDGVLDVQVSLASERAHVAHDPSRAGAAALVECLARAGYGATPYDPEALERPSARATRRAIARLLVAGFLAANAMSLSLALYLGSTGGIDAEVRDPLRWLTIALAVPAVGWCALPFWQGALAGLRRGRLGMDVPVVLGISTALAATVVGTLQGTTHVFADSAPTIVFLILLGRTLERGGRARSASAVERLLGALPPRALRCTPAGVEEVPPALLAIGDRVIVPPGAAFPADGCVARGATEVDESLVSGESLPVTRGIGDAVTGGTRNLDHEVEVEVTAPSARGALARIAALLERSQLARPKIQRVADGVAAVFAPAVLSAAAVAALGWWFVGAPPLDAALVGAAVLIVACPCALGLATPVAVASALGRGAAAGILFKSGEALERCAAIDVALLDKTGTVSEGRQSVREALAAPEVSAADVLAAAGAAEGSASHPIAEAVRRALALEGLRAAERWPRRAIPGRGVVAGEGAERICVGSRALLAEEGAAIPSGLLEAAGKRAERGQSIAFVAQGARALGALVLEDAPRADALEAIRRLRRLGVRTALVSGDHAGAAALAARRAGIEDVASEVSPEGKVLRVEAERRRGARVLFAGDGVNDAAALAAADVGIAFARGADVPVHAADVVVHARRLGAVPDAVELSRATLRRIRQGLAIALVYNAVAVPLAALGVLQPLSAAVAMSLSSLAVTANALRLGAWRPRA